MSMDSAVEHIHVQSSASNLVVVYEMTMKLKGSLVS